jgi:hypothetical protein
MTVYLLRVLSGCSSRGETILGRAQPSNVGVTYCNAGRPSDYGPTLHFLVLRFQTEDAARGWSDRNLSPIPAYQHLRFAAGPKATCSWPDEVVNATLQGSNLGRLDRVFADRNGSDVWLEGWEE